MFEGRVRLRTPEGELVLASGDAGVATPGAAPRPEIVARPRDAVAWALYYPPILAPLAEHRAAPSGLPQGLQTAVERVAANDYAGAIAALDAVPEVARDARYYTYRAGVLLNVGRADEAAQAIDRALALNPDAADALAQRAVIAVVQNRREQALADAKRAVELNPDSAPARIALSYAQQASFDLEAARATLREAAERTPENALVWARLAELELSFGNLSAAQTAADQAVALAPELERTQMVLGFAALTRTTSTKRGPLSSGRSSWIPPSPSRGSASGSP
jgi:tetratricopeptide (TPR) repeat protein